MGNTDVPAGGAPLARKASVSEMTIEKVLISDPIDPACVEILKAAGMSVDCYDKLTKEELLKKIPDYDALIVRSGTRVTKEIIEKSQLTIVGRAGTGVDNIDVDAATRHGVIVLNTPGGNTISAAEHTCAMLQAMCRHIPQSCMTFKNGKFDRKSYMGVELQGKTLGIVGLGRIGREVAKRMQAFGVKTIGYDPILPKDIAAKAGITAMELDQMWPQCDFITLHTPLTEQTRGLMNDAVFNKCKKGVRVVNCARGGIIDEPALLRALESGLCGGAAIDVFEEEPPTDETSLKLVAHPKCVATPHLGASTVEAQYKVAVEIADSIVKAAQGGQLIGAVNAPSLTNAFAPELQPWVVLATKLGQLIAQILGGDAFADTKSDSQIQNIKVISRGELLASSSETLTSGVLCGMLTQLSDSPINLVNATHYADQLGLTVTSQTSDADEYTFKNVLSVVVDTSSSSHVYEGAIFGKDSPRLITVDNYQFEARPEGHLLMYSNDDKPGVLGAVSTILGQADINIGDFNMGRNKKTAVALSILDVDRPVDKDTLDKIRVVPGIRFARLVDLTDK